MKKSSWLGLYWKDLFKISKKKRTNRLELLRASAFFEGFSDDQIELTSEFLHERKYAGDAFVFEVGHPGSALYFVTSGSISIEVPSKNDTIQLARLGATSFFGELALLDDSPRSASARTETDTTLLALPRSELDRMLKVNPILAGLIYKSLAKINSTRLRATIEGIQQADSMKLVANG